MIFEFDIRWKFIGGKPQETDPYLFSLLSVIRDKGSLRKTATSRFGLHFILLIDENCVLALDRNMDADTVHAVETLLTSRSFKSGVLAYRVTT